MSGPAGSEIVLLSSRNKGFHSALKDATFEKDTALTLEAFDANVGAEPDYLPLIAAAGVLLLEANHVAQLYLGDHCFYVRADT